MAVVQPYGVRMFKDLRETNLDTAVMRAWNKIPHEPHRKSKCCEKGGVVLARLATGEWEIPGLRLTLSFCPFCGSYLILDDNFAAEAIAYKKARKQYEKAQATLVNYRNRKITIESRIERARREAKWGQV